MQWDTLACHMHVTCLYSPEQVGVDSWEHEEPTRTAEDSEGREDEGGAVTLEIDSAQEEAVDQEDEWEVEHLHQLSLLRGTCLKSGHAVQDACLLMDPG